MREDFKEVLPRLQNNPVILAMRDVVDAGSEDEVYELVGVWQGAIIKGIPEGLPRRLYDNDEEDKVPDVDELRITKSDALSVLFKHSIEHAALDDGTVRAFAASYYKEVQNGLGIRSEQQVLDEVFQEYQKHVNIARRFEHGSIRSGLHTSARRYLAACRNLGMSRYDYFVAQLGLLVDSKLYSSPRYDS